MTICCVVGCNSRSSSKEKCYMAKLPSDPVRRKKWIENIEQVANTKKISSEASVCEKHFASYDWEKVRCDGKRKLRSTAEPRIFNLNPSVLSEKNDGTTVSETTPTVSSDENTSSQVDATLLLQNDENMETETIELEPQMSEERLQKSFSHLEWRYGELEKKYKEVLKQSRIFKKEAETLRKKNQKAERTLSAIKRVFNEDQIKVLCGYSPRGLEWSEETIAKALRLKSQCGSNGYEELLKLNYPFPSQRTLRRKSENGELLKVNSKEDLEHAKEGQSECQERIAEVSKDDGQGSTNICVVFV